MPYGTGTPFETAYAYASDNPWNFVDPSGNRSQSTNKPSASNPISTNGKPVLTKAKQASLIQSVVRNLPSKIGTCLGASANIVLAIEGQVCAFRGKNPGITATGGGGLGGVVGPIPAQAGAGGALVFTNAKRTSDLAGWSLCMEASGVAVILKYGPQVCIGLRNSLGNGINPNGFYTISAGLGVSTSDFAFEGRVTTGYTLDVPLPSPIKWALRHYLPIPGLPL